MVFISYSHKQAALKERLVTHLRVLQIEGVIEDVWDDSRLGALMLLENVARKLRII